MNGQQSMERFGTSAFGLEVMRSLIPETGPNVTFDAWTVRVPGYYQAQVEAIFRARLQGGAVEHGTLVRTLCEALRDELEPMRAPAPGAIGMPMQVGVVTEAHPDGTAWVQLNTPGTRDDIERQLRLFPALGSFTIVERPGVLTVSIDTVIGDDRPEKTHDRRLATAIERHLQPRMPAGFRVVAHAGPVWTFDLRPDPAGRLQAVQAPIGAVPNEVIDEIAVELDRRETAAPSEAAARHTEWWQRVVAAEKTWRASHQVVPVLPCFCHATPIVFRCTGCRLLHCTVCEMPILVSRDYQQADIAWWCAGCQAAGWPGTPGENGGS